MTELIEIPNKSSFKINEVCALTGVKSYVLRFWESEFTEIAPLVSSSGMKLYEHKDIEAILLIKKLLFEDKLSIDKAKSEMKILMPREQLVDESFAHFDEDSSGDFKFVSEHAYVEKIPAHPLQQSKTTRTIVESDIQNLVMAKSRLHEMLRTIERLHQKHDWR